MRESFWLVPAVIIVCCVVLGLTMIEVDNHASSDVLLAWPLLFAAGPDGSRAMLSAVATSMVTVAGITFSMTMVALTQTANYYSPRLLHNFVRDRSNQVVLGVFLGIFAYCLVVLRSIRSQGDYKFVPPLSVFVAAVLGVVSLAFLIYFIHHIATMLQASNIMSNVARQTAQAVDKLFPEPVGESDEEQHGSEEEKRRDWKPVNAVESGYLRAVNPEALLKECERDDVVVRMEIAVGGFAVEDQPILSVSGVLEENVERRLLALFPVAASRTIEQDAGFGIQEIVDIALKALSTGMNDTSTAVTAIQYLTTILGRLAQRRIETRYRCGRDGQLRVIACGPTFESLTSIALDQIRRNADGNFVVIRELLRAISTVSSLTRNPERTHVLLRHLELLRAVAQRSFSDREDWRELHRQFERVSENIVVR